MLFFFVSACIIYGFLWFVKPLFQKNSHKTTFIDKYSMKGLHFYYEKRRSIAKMELQNGRPENIDNRLDKEIRVYDFLDKLELHTSALIMRPP